MGNTIIFFIQCIIEAFIAKWYFHKISTLKLTACKENLTLSTGYLIFYIFSIFKDPHLNIISFFVVNCFLLMLICNLSKAQVLFHGMLMTVTMLATELFTESIFGLFFFNILDFVSDIRLYAIVTAMTKVTYALGINLILIFLNKYRIKKISTESNNIVILLISLLSLWVIILLNTIGRTIDAYSKQWIFIIICIILIFVMNILIIWVLHHNQKKHEEYIKLQTQLQKQKTNSIYYQTLSEQSEKQKILIHDIKQHISIIRSLCEQNDYERAKEYAQGLLEHEELKNPVQICSHTLLNLILLRYRHLAAASDINFKEEIRCGQLGKIKDEDITTIFCNLLDNAIESATGNNNAYIRITVTENGAKSRIVITVENSCLTAPVKNTKGNYQSTKHDKQRHGYGLKSIKKAADLYDGNIATIYNDHEQFFRTTVMLKI